MPLWELRSIRGTTCWEENSFSIRIIRLLSSYKGNTSSTQGIQSGLSTSKPSILWSTTSRVNSTKGQMHYQEGTSYSLPWNLKSLVLRLLRGCMPKMKTSRTVMRSAHRLTACSTWSMDSSSREPGYAYQRVGFGNFWFKSFMVELCSDILALRKLVACSKNTTIGQACPRMWNILWEGAPLASLPRAIFGIKVSILPSQFHMAYGKM